MEKYEVFSLIPARGGSKRIPKKNIKMLAGKPMMAWAIEASKGSKYIDRTFVSTEDKEIKDIALSYGAEVVDRPAELSRDDINHTFAYNHWKYYLWKEGNIPDYVVALTATSPMVTTKHINEAFELYLKSKSRMLVSVYKTKMCSPDSCFINDAGLMEHCLSKQQIDNYNNQFAPRHQEEKVIYYGNSVIGICHYNLFGNVANYSDYAEPYIMDEESSIDVDTPFDFKVAEMLMKERIKNKGG